MIQARWGRLELLTASLILLIASVAFIIYAFSQLYNGHNWGDDFGAYLHLARNILEGRPYDERYSGLIAPPGFPLLLAGWAKLFGGSFVALKTLNIASWVLATWLIFLLGRTTVGTPMGVLAALSHLCVPFYFVAQQSILTDIPFTVISTGFLLIAVRYVRTEQKNWVRLPWFQMAALAVLLISALLIRPAGIPLAAGLVGGSLASLLFNRPGIKNYRSLIGAIALTTFALALYYGLFGTSSGQHLQNALAGYSEGGRSFLSALAMLIKTRADQEVQNLHIVLLMFPIRYDIAIALVCTIAIGLVCYLIVSRDWVLPAYSAAYITVLLLTPWPGGPRYLLPILAPILIFAVAPGAALIDLLRHVSIPYPIRAVGFALVFTVAAVILVRMHATAMATRTFNDDETSDPQTHELLGWLTANTHLDERICSFKPRAIMYFTDRLTCPLDGAVPEPLGPFLDRQASQFAVLILRPTYPEYVQSDERVRKDPTVVEVFRNSDYAVYRRR